MLQVRSFKFSDENEINALLQNYPLAEGASVFVSNGELCIPIDDGEPRSASQKAIDLKVRINTMRQQIDLVDHSNHVLDLLEEDCTKRVTTAQADYDEVSSKTPKKDSSSPEKERAKQRLNEAKSALEELKSQRRQNDHEILRMNINIQLFEEHVAELNDGETKTN
jgi:hypothetical protein